MHNNWMRHMNREQWSSGIDSEINFWTRWIQTRDLSWPDDFKYRSDSIAELKGLARRYLEDFQRTPKVLDVGAGPMTALGKMLKGRFIDLIAVDALSNLYDQLPFPEGLPPLRTQKCETEKLHEKFAADTFDVAHAQNTLDHSYDPVTAIRQMIEVTKPGGFIITTHAANEALNENWHGFHQWNFHIDGRDFKISSQTQTFSVTEAITGAANIIELSPDNASWVTCVMKKV